ncbi:hypothetical protein BCEP27_60340 [Burkholderia cepacia]
MAIHPVALVCTAILGLLLFGLGFVVSVTRFRCTIGSGCASDPTNGLHKIVRAHGNTAERPSTRRSSRCCFSMSARTIRLARSSR